MDKDILDGLLALKLVAEKRNFTAAAAELGISPAAISKIMKQLERRLGVILFHRTTRATHLTEAGERFLQRAGPAVDQILLATKEVGTFADRPMGLLKINALKMVYPNYLKKVIAGFTKKYPDVTVEISFEDAAVDVFERGFDAGIRLSDILAKDVVAIKLMGPVNFAVAGAPEYFARMGRPKHPRDLLAHDCLRVRVSNWMYDRWEFEKDGEPIEVLVKGSLILNDSYQAIESTIDGMGLMYVSEDSVRDKVEAGSLELCLQSYSASSSGYYLYFPQVSQVEPKLRAFIDYAKEFQVMT
jgi:DNA-binding transcriptional LysR family regulator